jgi:hypothetical protein
LHKPLGGDFLELFSSPPDCLLLSTAIQVTAIATCARRHASEGTSVKLLAERKRFELSMLVLPTCSLSRGVPSTTRPPFQILWCVRRDSNPHAFQHYPLKIACLPIPPRTQQLTACRQLSGLFWNCQLKLSINELSRENRGRPVGTLAHSHFVRHRVR